MVAQRRPTWNASLDRAVHWAVELQRPLVILEALRAGYPWASDRLHQFVVEGMADNGRAFASAPATYYPYLESKPGEGRGLLESLAAASCLVVTDDFPCFFLPRMLEAAADKIDVPLEAVDGNGLYPMRATTKVFARAYDFRRFLQKQLRPHLDARPSPDPFRGVVLPDPPKIPSSILARWPMADVDAAATHPHWLDSLAIDHSVGVSPVLRGGVIAAEKRLDGFLHHGLPEYADSRNDATRQIASGLSPYLHFGHISAHQIFDRLVDRERWDASQIAEKAKGSRHGWWGMSEATESFLDELVTWRELGFNMCAHQADYDQYASLPQWARTTLSEHAGDPRPYVYELEHSKPPTRTMDFGTRPKRNCSARVGCTITCACYGARRSWSGRRRQRRRYTQ